MFRFKNKTKFMLMYIANDAPFFIIEKIIFLKAKLSKLIINFGWRKMDYSSVTNLCMQEFICMHMDYIRRYIYYLMLELGDFRKNIVLRSSNQENENIASAM